VTSLPDNDSLQRQLAEARENLHLIEERETEYPLSTDIPLLLVKEKRRLLGRIAELEQQLAAQPAEDDVESMPREVTKLTEVTEGEFELRVYWELVNLATEALMLSRWEIISEGAVCLYLYDKFVKGVNTFWHKVQKTIWPGKFPELESSIINLNDRLTAYVRHFLSNSRMRGKALHVEDQMWKLQPIDIDYRLELQKKSEEWQDTSTKLLFNVVVALNEFADSVRKHLDPSYLILRGRFVINDSLGILNEDGQPGIAKPKEYFEI
jgi:hypothetical protein